MRIFLITVLVFILSLSTEAQFSKARISIPNYADNLPQICWDLWVMHNADTVYYERVTTNYEKDLDSLSPGIYVLKLRQCLAGNDMEISKPFLVKDNTITNVTVNADVFEEYRKLDSISGDEILKDRMEFSINMLHQQNSNFNPTSYLKTSSALGYSQYIWNPFSKHLGFLMGGGLGLSYYSFSQDTSYLVFPGPKKRSEYYLNFDGHLDAKFRISLGNQQSSAAHATKLFLDIGAGYYLPFIFNHVARYPNDKKLTNKHIHTFADFRAFVNLAFSTVGVYAEYRPLNTISGNYPQLPMYSLGIRLFLQDAGMITGR